MRKINLLIIDDDEKDFGLMIENIKNDLKFDHKLYDTDPKITIAVATSKDEGLRLVSKNNNFDLILLDINFKNGEKGFDICNDIKKNQNLKHIPVVFITSHTNSDVEVIEKCYDSGGVDYISKSSSLTERMKRIKCQIILKITQEVEQKHNTMKASLEVANRIQKALLPTNSEISENFPHSFIIYKPKEVVSGDFYWMKEKGDKIFLAAADCTGHGVPAAFMSAICRERLNEAIIDYNDVSEMLNFVNRRLKKQLHQDEKHGMDIALCAFNKEMNLVEYAGAFRPFWILEIGKNGIEEKKYTPWAIGHQTEDHQEFTKHSIPLNKGDLIYLSSDGFVSQFNCNEKGLGKRNLKTFLLSIKDKKMEEQKVCLDNFIEEWKGGIEQTDDILLIGIKI